MDFSQVDKKALFNTLLKQGFIFRLKGSEPFTSSDYHVFVVLNYDPTTGKLLYLVNGTSQVQKRLTALWSQSIDTNATTVAILAGKYPFFPKDTLIDCNTVSELNVSGVNFTDDTVELVYNELDASDIQTILQAAKNSTTVEGYIKKLL